MFLRRLLPPVLFLTALTLAVFLPVADNGFVSFDDDRYLTANPAVQQGLTAPALRWAWTTTHAGNWHPLTWISHMLDVHFFGLDAGRHHLAGLAIHTINAILLFLLLAALTGALWRSLLVAALFAIHPLHVESVAWAAERKDLLAGLFWMLTAGAYLGYTRRPNARRLAAVHVLFALGLLAKPMIVTFPFVALLLDLWPLDRIGRGWRSLLLEKAPLFLLAAASSLATYLIQRSQGALPGPLLAFGDRAANSLLSYVAYLRLTFFPHGLAFFYPFRLDWSFAAAAAAALLLLGVTVAAVVCARRLPFVAVGWFWYLGMLVPVSGLVQAGGQALADRYTYLPLIGIFIVLAWGLGAAVERSHHGALPAGAAAVAAVALLAILSRGQVAVWHDDITLYRQALAHTRGNFVALTNLGGALSHSGRAAEALDAFSEASRLRPQEWRPRLGRAEALASLGRFDEAAGELRSALTLNPGTFEGRNYLGLMLLRLGRLDEARQEFLSALDLNPAYADPMNNLGTIELACGRPEAAVQWFRRALAAHRDFPAARANLERALRHPGAGVAPVRQ